MSHAPSSVAGSDPRERFERLAEEWEAASRFLSSVHQMSMHRAYQQIIGMGPAALPLIFERMHTASGHWFWALQAITGEDPVLPDHRGDLAAMTRDWLDWRGRTGAGVA